MSVLAFARLGRPHFLVGGLALYGLGAAVAAVARGPLDVRAYAWGQAAITTTQLMTHYSNDYFDLVADRANESPTAWSGGSRVLPDGELSPRVALVAAVVLAVGALGLDGFIGLRVASSPAVLPLLIAALLLSWGYSAPPLRLHSRGIGAPTAALVVTLLTPLTAYFLQVRGPVLPLLAAALPLTFAQIAMILVVDFPDAAGDAVAGKKTLVVQLGGRAAGRLCIAAVGAPYVALPALAMVGLPGRVVIGVLSSAPLAGLLLASLARGDWERPSRWTRLTSLAVVWFGFLTIAELASFVSLLVGRS